MMHSTVTVLCAADGSYERALKVFPCPKHEKYEALSPPKSIIRLPTNSGVHTISFVAPLKSFSAFFKYRNDYRQKTKNTEIWNLKNDLHENENENESSLHF